MEWKLAEGNVRNKEKSKEKFLAAVGIIIKTEGLAALKVNNIAIVAGLDKKLLSSGIYYLDIYATTNENTFCELDFNSKAGRAVNEEGLSFLVDMSYNSYNH